MCYVGYCFQQKNQQMTSKNNINKMLKEIKKILKLKKEKIADISQHI